MIYLENHETAKRKYKTRFTAKVQRRCIKISKYENILICILKEKAKVLRKVHMVVKRAKFHEANAGPFFPKNDAHFHPIFLNELTSN